MKNEDINSEKTSTFSTTSLSQVTAQDTIQDFDQSDDDDDPSQPENFVETNQKLKGFKIDTDKRVICLDCDKVFMLKSSYNIHKRM